MSAEGVARNGGVVDAHAPANEVDGEILTSSRLDSRRALMVAIVLTVLAAPFLVMDALPSGTAASVQAQGDPSAQAYIPARVTTTAEPTTTTAAPTTTVAPTTTAAPTTTVAPTTTAAPTTTVPTRDVAAAQAPTTAAPTTAPPTTAAPTTTPPTVGTAPSSSDAEFLACTRQRESRGDYTAVNPVGYYGAYQFAQTTWNNTASHAGRGDLVGVRPDRVAPADQDAMALHLLHWVGKSPWGGYC